MARPIKTEVTVSVQRSNGKWASAMNTFVQYGEEWSLFTSCESGAVWDTQEEADAGAVRAIEVLDATGKYPNMCERW